MTTLKDDLAYRGYVLDQNGHVVEHYDHTDETQTQRSAPFQQTRFNPNLITNIQNIPSNHGSDVGLGPSAVPHGNGRGPQTVQPTTVQLVPTAVPVPAMSSMTPLLQQPVAQMSQISPAQQNISQQPIVVLDEHKKSGKGGCCAPCGGCCKSCTRMPCCSIFSFFLVIAGTAMICVCGWLSMQYSFNLWEDYGPPKGNPVFDPAPIWIKNVHSNVGFDWYKVNPEYRPGNYLPWVREGLEYFLIALAPFMFITALLMLVSSYVSAKEIHERSTYTVWSSVSETNVCCTMFLLILNYFLMVFFIVWSCFSALAVYYYRMVEERCWNLNGQGFDAGVQKSICLDLVQLGVARFIPTTDEGYGLLCGQGNNVNGIKIYGDLTGYCENYVPTYVVTILAFAGGPIVMLGLMNYLMVLSTNYSIITGKYVKKFVKMDARTVNVKPGGGGGAGNHISRNMLMQSEAPTQSTILPSYNGAVSSMPQNRTIAYNQTNFGNANTVTETVVRPDNNIRAARYLRKKSDGELENYYKD